MSFKSALSKIGAVLSKAEGVLTVLSPVAGIVGGVASSLLPGNATATKVINEVTGTGLSDASALIQNVEAFGQALQLTGAQKLTAATGPMVNLLQLSNDFDGKKIQDQALFNAGAAKIASGLADCWNAISPDSVKTTIAS